MKPFTKFLLLGLTVILFSCQINSTIHFNKDYSGTNSTTIDLSEAIAFEKFTFDDSEPNETGELDSLFMLFDGGIDKDNPLSQITDSVKKIMDKTGMKNFAFSKDGEYGLNMSYDFDDLSVFNGEGSIKKMNNVMSNSDVQLAGEENDLFSSIPSNTSIVRKGKWLIIDFFGGMTYDTYKEKIIEEAKKEHIKSGGTEDDFSAEQSVKDAMSAGEMMTGMMEFNTTYTFERKVKEVESSLPYKSDQHSVTLSYDYGELIDALKEGGQVVLKVKLR